MYSIDRDGNFIDNSRTLREIEAVMKDFQDFIEFVFIINEIDEKEIEVERENLSIDCNGASLMAKLYLETKKRFFIMKDDDLITKDIDIKA